MRRLLTVLATLALAAAACAQSGQEVALSVEPPTVTIGEPFAATVEFTLPADHEPVIPGEDAGLDGAEVRSVEQLEEAPLPNGSTRYSVTYTLVLWEVGEKTLTSPAIASRAPDGAVEELEAAQATVTVSSVLPEGAEEIRDIRGPREMPLRWHHYVIAALPVVALIALIVLLVRWLRSRRRADAGEPAAPLLTPAEEALRALDELEREELATRGEIKEHYVRLSWIVRNYIERRWRLPAFEETTGMLEYTMSGSGRIASEAIAAITAVLRRADLAKFAKHRPEPATAREDIENARDIVRMTRPREEVAEDAASDDEVAPVAD